MTTLGPASATPEAVRDLFEAGADVFRLNFSHGTHRAHAERVRWIREVERAADHPIGILMDLQGPKLRIGAMAGGEAVLEAGAAFRLDLSPEPGDGARAPLPHPEVFEAIRQGTELLIDDGRIRLAVRECATDHAVTEILFGGRLSDHKGVNIPQAVLPISALTDKDRRDLDFALTLGIDWIGLSFVQRPDDVAAARRIIGGKAAVMAKLEKPAAIGCLDEILALSDGVMVARGDLGVELPPEDVPSIQKQVVRRCREAGKPVVVATQMLESMIAAPAPTRAEASDVATAVYDGADAVMLSAETATGAYPREAVSMMSRSSPGWSATRPIAPSSTPSTSPGADRVRRDQRRRRQGGGDRAGGGDRHLHHLGLDRAPRRARTPRRAARGADRAAGDRALPLRRLGVHCVVSPDVGGFAEMVEIACERSVEAGFAESGQRLVITAGVPFGTPGATNILHIAWIAC